MDRYRFYVPNLAAGAVGLPEDQAHHAIRVLRLQTGAEVELFDGEGAWGAGVLEVGPRSARATVARLERDEPPRVRLTLATAVPKADRAEWLIEQASQLNAATVAWLDCERGVVRPKERGGKMDKWRRLAVESAKQCGRNWVLEVQPMRPLGAMVDAALARGARMWWLEPRQGARVDTVLGAKGGEAGKGGEIVALIGPEGGWSTGERALLEGYAAAGKIAGVKLTPTVLRIETACAAVAALVGCLGGNAQ